ncbi:hypothetical protein B0H14DRAFT_3158404 [Mycena olivaceomarginata]|nr:hypothetical protein B0H14DRAFT_3158404 [Mycena olivaceomarginata]
MVRVLEGTGVEVTQVALPVGSDQSTWAMVEDILADAIKPDDIQNRVNLPGRETRIVRWVTLRGTGLLHVYIIIVKKCAAEHAETATQHSLRRNIMGSSLSHRTRTFKCDMYLPHAIFAKVGTQPEVDSEDDNGAAIERILGDTGNKHKGADARLEPVDIVQPLSRIASVKASAPPSNLKKLEIRSSQPERRFQAGWNQRRSLTKSGTVAKKNIHGGYLVLQVPYRRTVSAGAQILFTLPFYDLKALSTTASGEILGSLLFPRARPGNLFGVQYSMGACWSSHYGAEDRMHWFTGVGRRGFEGSKTWIDTLMSA